MNKYNCILILGPTASGKTKLAVEIACKYKGEIISIDSRQVYKQLDIGTGKDLQEYGEIPFHLIDIIEPTRRYHVHAFAKDFYKVFSAIKERGNLPVLCGGTGLYMDVILKKNELVAIPVNEKLREELKNKSLDELKELFSGYSLNEKYRFDQTTIKRLIRSIEIADYLKHNPVPEIPFHDLKPLILGVKTTLEQRRSNITKRLHQRIENGMMEEAEGLIAQGVSHEQLQYFGLEYKFLSFYLLGKISKEEMITQLETAIHQYAKRQMTWWRKTEKEGFMINWVQSLNEAYCILNNEISNREI